MAARAAVERHIAGPQPDGAHLGRCSSNRNVDPLLELLDAARLMFNFVQMINDRGLLGGLLKVLLLHPLTCAAVQVRNHV